MTTDIKERLGLSRGSHGTTQFNGSYDLGGDVRVITFPAHLFAFAYRDNLSQGASEIMKDLYLLQ